MGAATYYYHLHENDDADPVGTQDGVSTSNLTRPVDFSPPGPLFEGGSIASSADGLCLGFSLSLLTPPF